MVSAAGEVTGFFRVGAVGSSGYNFAWSLALLGAGHLVGLSVGIAMLVGLVISWGIAVPILTSLHPAAAGVTLAAHTITIWRTQVRFIGAGAIAVAAIEQMFFFVPGSLGTLEMSRFKTLSLLGVDDGHSVAFALIMRLHNLFWNGLGLLVYVLCTRTALVSKPIQPVASPPPALPPTVS